MSDNYNYDNYFNDNYSGWDNINFDADGDLISEFTKGYNNGYKKGKDEGYIRGRDDVKNMVLQLIDLGLDKRKAIFNTDSVQEILNTFDVFTIRKTLEANKGLRVGDIVTFTSGNTLFGKAVTSSGVITAIDEGAHYIITKAGFTYVVYASEILRVTGHLKQTEGFLHALDSAITHKEDEK